MYIRRSNLIGIITVAVLSLLLLCACGDRENNAAEEPQETGNEVVSETHPETTAVSGVNEPDSVYFGAMHVVITDVQSDEKSCVYTFIDRADPDNAWGVAESEFSDILIDGIDKGTEAVVFFNGDVINDDENVRFLLMVPEDKYSLKKLSGTIVSNMMSAFEVMDASGRSVSFVKANCRIEEGLDLENSDNKVVVYYAVGSDGINLPLKVYKAE